MSFTHLHVHSQYSILDGATRIKDIVSKAKADGMNAVALTDHGNMFGIKAFYDECRKGKIKPILGCEAYVARRGRFKKESKEDRSGEHLIVLAKNLTGYKNLTKICSLSHIEGMYYRPRIDKELLQEYHEGLIVSSACLGGEIDQRIMRGDLEGAEKCAEWYQSIFGEDYYLEVMRHPAVAARQREEVYEQQILCIKEKVKIAQKLGIKLIATNDVHFLNEEDAEAQDLLICLNTRKDIDDPTRMRYTRQEWFKTTAEMSALFSDMPEALENTSEVAAKVEEYELDSDPIMPVFPIPEEFGTETEYRKRFSEKDLFDEFTCDEHGKRIMDDEAADKKIKKLGGYSKLYRTKLEADYLKELTLKGAAKRYGNPVPDDIMERLIFELHVMKTMGFPGYFLIVQDFISAARKMGVIVGPGRGSAAGSAVAYCLGITNINPLKYNLLFERFLNPDRISLPDIDVDFDDEGRQKVMEWVTQKYGQDKVCHIVTFGSMAAKMAIKDVARVLKLELPEANRLAKMVPEVPKITLEKAYKENPDLAKEKKSPNPLIVKTLDMAEKLEGSIRQPGIHACGIIISRDPLTEHIPIIPTEGESLMTTQYDGHFVEPIGLIKMDFLGLSTLSIIKTCLNNIQLSKNITVDENQIPLDDKETFELFSKGETTGLFQFESPGMKKHLKALQPNRFEDLVAMNALYRPGPMEYIPQFIARKHGKEKIEYEHPMMEPFLKDTYGITVYQEQVMLQSRALGNFTRGQSDTLRKAMGKKKIDLMNELKGLFMEGCKNNPEFVKGCKEKGKPVEDMVNKIWGDWEAFASYAFNKSHSVCYAYIAYQTGYLKTHYPAEFMAANLTNNKDRPDKITAFMEECKRMHLNVLSPDINESFNDFTVNSKGDIRFGLSAIKGVGENAAESIISERAANGLFKSVYDFFERIDFKSVNRKTIENLISAGGFDSLEFHRAQYFQTLPDGEVALDVLYNYGQCFQADKLQEQNSLFFGLENISITKPDIPDCERWKEFQQATIERDLIGQFLTSHPLNPYYLEMLMCSKMEDFSEDLTEFNGMEKCYAGIITNIKEGKTRNGQDFAIVTVADYSSDHEFAFFRNDFIKYRNFFIKDTLIYIKGTFCHKWNNENAEMTFNVSKIDLLGNLASNSIRSLTLLINVNDINDEIIDKLANEFTIDKATEKKVAEETGETYLPFKIKLFDENKLNLTMVSRKLDITKSKALFDYAKESGMFNIEIEN